MGLTGIGDYAYQRLDGVYVVSDWNAEKLILRI